MTITKHGVMRFKQRQKIKNSAEMKRKATCAVERGKLLKNTSSSPEINCYLFDGFYYLVDRKKDVIISGGENIYPVQIENFLMAHPKIKDVAVIGLPDKRLGEITGAIISIKEGMECTEEEINEFCMDLPRYKRPKKVIFADVPRNATGKIEKPALRKKYGVEKLVAQESGI